MQKECHKLEKWVNRSVTKVSKGKSKVLLLQWDNPMPQDRLHSSWTAALQKMTPGPCGQKVEYESAVCPCSHRGNGLLGYTGKSAASRLRKVILLCSALGRYLKTCTQFWALQYKKDIDVLEQVQEKQRWVGADDHDVQKGVKKDELTQDSEEKANRRSYCCL